MDDSPRRRGGGFASTRWSVVLAAGDQSRPEARAALDELCRTYWYPLYAFVRRQGRSAHDAEDAVQGFLAALIARDRLRIADPERGRFRSFLLASLKNHLHDLADRATAIKRGGGAKVFSIDARDAEGRYACEPSTAADPESAFLRDWAETLLADVLSALRREYDERGREETFALLKGCLYRTGDYDVIAQSSGMSRSAVRVAVHRLRGRYRELLRSHIAETLPDGGDVEQELHDLMAALAAE